MKFASFSAPVRAIANPIAPIIVTKSPGFLGLFAFLSAIIPAWSNLIRLIGTGLQSKYYGSWFEGTNRAILAVRGAEK